MLGYIGDHFVAFTVASMVAFILVLGSVSIVEAIAGRRQG